MYLKFKNVKINIFQLNDISLKCILFYTNYNSKHFDFIILNIFFFPKLWRKITLMPWNALYKWQLNSFLHIILVFCAVFYVKLSISPAVKRQNSISNFDPFFFLNNSFNWCHKANEGVIKPNGNASTLTSSSEGLRAAF